MTATDRPRTPQRSGPPAGPSPAARGLILVGVGVVLGLILLVRAGGVGFQSGDEGVKINTDEAAVTTTISAPTTTVPTTDKAPQQVKVVVANGSPVSGLAGKTTAFLAQNGYSNSTATDAQSQVSVTTVYYSPGFEASAKALARILGLNSSQVQALPNGAELAKNQPSDAGVVVIAGPEIATIVGASSSTSGSGSSGTSGSSGSGSSGSSGSSGTSGSTGSSSSGSGSSGSGSTGSGSSGSGSTGSSSSGSGSSGSGSSGSGSSGSGSSGSGSSSTSG
ncbi:MAG: LytR C-terminal domain-containing protein [Microthrixaceae bacterium]